MLDIREHGGSFGGGKKNGAYPDIPISFPRIPNSQLLQYILTIEFAYLPNSKELEKEPECVLILYGVANNKDVIKQYMKTTSVVLRTETLFTVPVNSNISYLRHNEFGMHYIYLYNNTYHVVTIKNDIVYSIRQYSNIYVQNFWIDEQVFMSLASYNLYILNHSGVLLGSFYNSAFQNYINRISKYHYIISTNTISGTQVVLFDLKKLEYFTSGSQYTFSPMMAKLNASMKINGGRI
ncbi:hypothetical protein [Kurthia senegalensis]|uniref:hypothetical protein n=1 Tax=Kurthia senegalensis TaxID=1033740 RepID=UPI000288D642|nr:hypothetical protein [Kurthia senegalensis]